jgi:hypothetical protein
MKHLRAVLLHLRAVLLGATLGALTLFIAVVVLALLGVDVKAIPASAGWLFWAATIIGGGGIGLAMSL